MCLIWKLISNTCFTVYGKTDNHSLTCTYKYNLKSKNKNNISMLIEWSIRKIRCVFVFFNLILFVNIVMQYIFVDCAKLRKEQMHFYFFQFTIILFVNMVTQNKSNINIKMCCTPKPYIKHRF
jgi:hypothetical protein